MRWLSSGTRMTLGLDTGSSRVHMRRDAEVALATCALLPALDADEAKVIPALAAHGIVGLPAVWDDRSVHWGDHRLVVVRSTWDYAPRRDEFLRWVESLPRVCNPAHVIRWNTDKAYLRELDGVGIAVVPTTWIAPGDRVEEIALPRGEIVIKPAISAGGQHTCRYAADEHGAARKHADRLLRAGRSVMVQPYFASVDVEGETGLVFFDGEFSHAFRKGAVLRDPTLAPGGLWASETIHPRDPRADELALAARTLDALAWPAGELLYARVDVVRDQEGAPMVIELELAEPSLYLRHGQGAAERFAAAIVRRIQP